MPFEIVIEPPALQDIQEAIDYYDEQQVGLGEKFESELNKYFTTLLNIPFFQIRYDKNRCLPLKKFPYMIHYTVDEENEWIVIRAVLNTHRDPGIWKSRK